MNESGIHGLIGDHMVLQRDMPLTLRGVAPAASAIAVNMAGREASGVAGIDGKWRVTLPPLDAGGPHELTITIGDAARTFTDILIGDVWLCGGQSNMVFALNAALDAEAEIAAADHPALRVATIAPRPRLHPADDVAAPWQVCTPDVAGAFSAVGYFFARHVMKSQHVPVGLIVAANGHTPCETWMSREALESQPDFAPLLENLDNLIAQSPGCLDDLKPWRDKYKAASKAHNQHFNPWYPEALAARAEGRPIPPMPVPPQGIGNPQNPTMLYNGMIAPLEGFPIRGMLWYQGETNAIFGTGPIYDKLLAALADSYRYAWAQGNFPFIYVQIANHDDVQCDPADELWPQVRESQRRALRDIPNSAMVVAIDVGESAAIHPPNKQAVGHRLALAAEALAYGDESVIWSGPLYRSSQIKGDTVRIHFDHAHAGLDLRDDKGFELSADGKHWHAAVPTIDHHDLVLHAAAVATPRAARYAWKADPVPSLYNGAGLPASPFTTTS